MTMAEGVATTTTSVLLEALQRRVDVLERSRYQLPTTISSGVDEQMRRARLAVEDEKKIYSAVWKFVPEPYYSWPLEERAKCLGTTAGSVQPLCKSLLMENRKNSSANNNNNNDDADPTNPKFVMVIIQYGATLDVKKLTTAIRALRPVKDRLDDNQFDFRIASQEDNDTLTGYKHNSVTPFGLLCSSSKHTIIPIVLSEAVVPLKFIWMGGGHVHLKLGMAVSEFCSALQPIVADISDPRVGVATSEELDA